MRVENQHQVLKTGTWFLWIWTILCLMTTGAAWAASEYTNRDDLFSISFPDEKFGWTCGRWGTVLHTVDGGKSWQEQKTGVRYTLGGIFFVDRNTGWAVGNMGTIIHTSDGGKTWEQQDCPVPYYLMDVFFVSPEKGWIVTEQTHILYTEDGGRTWDIQFQDADYILKSLSFFDETHGWAVGEFGHIYRTTDGGHSWEKLAGGAEINDIGDLVGEPYLFDIAVIDEKTAWAVGIEGRVIRTEDRGNTWIPVETGATNTQLFSITYNGDQTLVIAGKGVCLISENMGRTWRQAVFNPPIEYTWIYALETLDPSHFATCGEEGGTYIGDAELFKKVR